MATEKDKGFYIDIIMKDREKMGAAKTIIGYEANVRGVPIGQAVLELVRKAIDEEDYPEEIRDQLREYREKARAHAVERALAAGEIQKTA